MDLLANEGGRQDCENKDGDSNKLRIDDVGCLCMQMIAQENNKVPHRVNKFKHFKFLSIIHIKVIISGWRVNIKMMHMPSVDFWRGKAVK